jgi:carboxyl-terminal processing protease
MLSKLSEQKNQDLVKFKSDVLEILESEIIRRYFSETGVIEYSFKNDKDMKAAIELFNNKAEYQKILKK